MTLGETLYQARIDEGLSQERLSELSGVNEDYISKIERGKAKAPTLKKILAIADVLPISIYIVQNKDIKITTCKGGDTIILLKTS